MGDKKDYNNKNMIISILLIVLIGIILFFSRGMIFNIKDYDVYRVDVNVGEVYSFGNDTDTLFWKSSDESIALVDNDGNVSALNIGVVTITAYDDADVVYEYVIEVLEKKVTNLNFIKDNITLENGDSYKIELDIEPSDYNYDKLIWSSSDEGVAIVNDGVVIDKREGTSIIRVESLNGVVAVCSVIVKGDNDIDSTDDNKVDLDSGSNNIIVDNDNSSKDNNVTVEVELEKIIFDKDSIVIYELEKYQSIIKFFSVGVDASNITYVSSDDNIVTVSSTGLITGVSAGSAVITAKVDGLTAKMNVKVLKAVSNSKTITVKFNKNGSDKIGSTSEKCKAEGEGCKVKLPTIERMDYKILGWSRNSDAIIPEYKVGDSVVVYSDSTYYAITSRNLTATFNSNGATVSEKTKVCTIYNKDSSCSIVTPSIVRSGYNIVGWGASSSATIKSVDINSSVSLASNINYYAITYKVITAMFEANRSTISKTSASCNCFNQDSSCKVVSPTITRNNYSVLGWGTRENANSVTVSSGGKLVISTPTTYYAITKINKDGVEKGCTGWMSVNTYYYSNASTSSSKVSISAGTVFTIEEVVGDYFKVSIPNVTGYKYILHKYVMINLADYIPSMVMNITNASSSIYKSSGYELPGVSGTKLYSAGKVYNVRLLKNEYMVPVLYAVAKKLLVAQNTLLAKGYSIKVYDTYRPHSVSVKIYNSLSGLYDSNTTVKNNILYSYGASGTRYTWGKAWFLASSVSTHNVGAAIDMSLVYKSNGKEVTMPTVMHELSTKAIKYYSSSVSKVPANYSKEMNDMAKIMDSAATNAGLTTLASEWWHFQDNAARDLIVKLQPNGCDFQVTKVYSY